MYHVFNMFLSSRKGFSLTLIDFFSDINFPGNIAWILILKNQEYLVVWYLVE